MIKIFDWLRRRLEKKYIKITPEELEYILDLELELLLTDDIPSGGHPSTNPLNQMYSSGEIGVHEVYEHVRQWAGGMGKDRMHEDFQRLMVIHARSLRMLLDMQGRKLVR